ncbi:hypothetical protein [Jeongeupia naejangsanensis]|uniref:HNH endonuclease 5 domain-containing protein n=1 Tax=Jeongeupia naejangsanensis TaxID=613195 RepID=A0ABS2BF65_9NEIS|nr:hypothetical protein [Jeongeupia naejangsanensis]MBM3114253.1 hypothetical protein [Jeongeupia naejangsanensis]
MDDRLKGVCTYCDAVANSRDHVPSKILLDEPYPDNLPVAESCVKCNQGFSASEEYFACLLECVINGTTTPSNSFREKIRATLMARPLIARKIECGKDLNLAGQLLWKPDFDRVKEVVLKLARGHIAYELGVRHTEEPDLLEIIPMPSMSEFQMELFLSLNCSHLYPEIGSRAFVNLFAGKPMAYEQWYTVQESRYKYSVGQSRGDWVKIVISDYLACHVAWE